MNLHLNVIGFLLIVLSIVHAIFPKYFNWENEFRSLSLINRQMMYVHTFFLALTLFLMGILCLTSAKEIVETELGKRLALGLGIFWIVRLFFQFLGYSSKLWKGKIFETTIHILFSILWTYLSFIFISIYLTSSAH